MLKVLALLPGPQQDRALALLFLDGRGALERGMDCDSSEPSFPCLSPILLGSFCMTLP